MKKIALHPGLLLVCFLSFGFQTHAQNPALDKVENLQTHANNIYSSGQPEPGAFAAFAKLGVSDVINLRAPEEMKSIPEEAAVSAAGMRYHNIAIKDIEDLNRSNATRLHQLLAQSGNENTLIHCRSSNRVGALMALRAVWLQDKNTSEALAIGKQYGLTSLEPEVIKILKQ